MERNNPFNDTIENFNKAVDSIDKITRENNKEETEAKDKSSKENDDPGYVLYNAIANNSIELLSNPIVINTFKKISESFGEEISKSLVEMFAILLTQSSYQAILFYDSLLKKELDVQFNHFVQHINMAKADIEAHHGVLKVFKQQLNDINNKLKIEKINK